MSLTPACEQCHPKAPENTSTSHNVFELTLSLLLALDCQVRTYNVA